MTLAEKIRDMNDRELEEFLFAYAEDTLNAAAVCQYPSRQGIREMLQKERTAYHCG